LEGHRQKHQAAKVVVAMEPTNYFWKLLARELEEKQLSYRLDNWRGVRKLRILHLKSEIAQLELSDLRCGKHTGMPHTEA
jgi:hypothetical protein